MRDSTFTITTALIGIAGAIAVSCAPTPAAAEPPTAHPCYELVPTLQTLHENAAKGLPAALLRHLALTDERLSGIGRYFHAQTIAFIDNNPVVRGLPFTDFLPAVLDVCKAQYGTDHLIGRLEGLRTLEHGDI